MVGVGACSFIFDMSADQCTTDDDCAKLAEGNVAFDGTRCIENVCTPFNPGQGGQGGGSTEGCVSSKQCTEDNAGQPYICRNPGEECVSLLSEDCLEVIGNYSDPNAIIIGAVTAWSGDLPSEFMRRATLCTFEQALGELDAQIVGLPNPEGGERRPVALVACSESTDTVRAFNHLVDNVGAKVVLGPLFHECLDSATQVTVPKEILHIVPACAVPGLRKLDTDLVWTVIPSLAITMKSLPKLVTHYENEFKTADPNLDKIRVLMTSSANDEDPQIGQYLLDENLITSNGVTAAENQADTDPQFCPDGCFKYLDATAFQDTNGVVDYAPLVGLASQFNPHIILALTGDGDLVLNAMPQVESTDTSTPDPIWIFRFPDPQVPGYIQGALGFDPPVGVENRILGVDFVTYHPLQYNDFALRFGSVCPEMVPPNQAFFPPTIQYWYDAVFLAVLSHLAGGNAAIPTDELTGPMLAKGMIALSPLGHTTPNPTKIELKPSFLPNIVNALVQGQEVDLDGVSGPLDFNDEYACPTTDDTVPDMNIVCISPGSAPPDTVDWALTGTSYDYESHTLSSSTITCP